MVVLEASKEDRQNATPEKPPRKQILFLTIVLTLAPAVKMQPQKKTTPNQARAVQQINLTERPYTPIAPQNSISDGNDSRDMGSEKKALQKTIPNQAKTAQLGILKERPKPILLSKPLSDDDDGHDKRPYETIASEESMLDDSDYEVGGVLDDLFD